MTGKTVAVTGAPGHLVRFVPLPGQARDISGIPDLLEGLEFRALTGDGRWTPTGLPGRWRGGAPGCAMAVMSSRRNRLAPRDRDDGEMCKWRHRVGNFLAKTGEFRAIATRYDKRDKTGASHAAAIHLAAWVMAAKQLSTRPNGTVVLKWMA
ncbi:MAG: hypothetical protein OXC66_08370 [Roseovarius sp.]|nr:hypothetical protein [Roseovarius sp.]